MACVLWTALLRQPRLLSLYEALLAGFSLLLAVMIVRRIRSLRGRPALKLSPHALHEKLGAGDQFLIFDLRERLDILTEPYRIPGAVHVSQKQLSTQLRTIAKDRPVVFYCTCPNEKSLTRMAASLRQNGFTRLWVLAGGMQAWRTAGLPVEPATIPAESPAALASKVARVR